MLAEVASFVFADMADPREFVSKMNPTGSELHAPGSQKDRSRQRKLAATGLAATGVASVGGAHAISATIKENKARTGAAHAAVKTAETSGTKPETAGRLARVARGNPVRAAELTGAAWLGLHGVELTGDALALHAQGKQFRANKPAKRSVKSARAGSFRRVEVAKGLLGGAKQAGKFARHVAHSEHMAQQARDVAKPLPGLPWELPATRSARESATVKAGDKAAKKANRREGVDTAKQKVSDVAASPRGQQALSTAITGFKRASVKPTPKPLIKNPAATAGAGALAGATGLAFTQRRRREPIAARAPQAVIDDLEYVGTISKVDTDQRLAFGWASISKLNGQPYVDRQGDWIPTEDAEKAAYQFVKDTRVGGDMHRRGGITKEFGPHKVADLVESFFCTPEKLAAMGVPESVAKSMPEAWWIGMKYHDEETWQDIKAGRRTGFSVHGTGVRKDVTL